MGYVIPVAKWRDAGFRLEESMYMCHSATVTFDAPSRCYERCDAVIAQLRSGPLRGREYGVLYGY